MGVYGDRHGTGAFVRKVRFSAEDTPAGGVVRGDLQDDMHHFVVEVHHDFERVTGVAGYPVRWPWTQCLESPAALQELVGAELGAPLPHLDVRQQCTHQFDLAQWCIGHAAQHKTGDVRYVARVPDWTRPPFEAVLERNGEVLLAWTLDGTSIIAPESFAGASLKGFGRWAAAHLEPYLVDAAMILRRAVWLSPARHSDLEACSHISESGVKHSICYASQPQRVELARRNKGSLRNISG